MREIVEHTHYMPAEWKDKLHSSEVSPLTTSWGIRRVITDLEGRPGSRRVRQAVPDEGHPLPAGDLLGSRDALRTLVHSTEMRRPRRRFLPRIYDPRRRSGIRVQLCREHHFLRLLPRGFGLTRARTVPMPRCLISNGTETRTLALQSRCRKIGGSRRRARWRRVS